MKKIIFENLYDVLLNMKNEMILNEEIRIKVLKLLENMYFLGLVEVIIILEVEVR